MAVQKIYPSRMDKDTSPFKLKDGDIIDALNMSIAEYGGSSAGVYKPVKGTNYVPNAITASFSNNSMVIGTAADPSRDRVYFFVKAGLTPGGGIYMCSNVSTSPVVSRVFASPVLNLQSSNFVKVDVINADFSQDGSINTMLYFTDNVNEPRRINVDRAIAGQYSTSSTEDLKYMLSVCKAAPINVPTFRFDTEANLYDNNMNGNCFQFALQYIYEDGEESAISSYSKLAYNRYTASETDDASASMRYRDNVCLIDLSRVNTTPFPAPQSLINGSTSAFPISSVSKLRLLGRNGNAGAFFVIDEFDPDKNLERYINGGVKTVYGFGQKIYRFYNDGLYSPVSSEEVNKLYDNVPLQAVGQCIAGNRLMYSNYKEGRPNVDVSSGTLTPVYSAEPAIGNINTPNQNPTVVSTGSVDSKERIIINLTSTGGFQNTSTSIPSGSAVNLSFKFKPSANITRTGSLPSVYTFKYTVEDSNGEKLDVYMDSATQNFPETASSEVEREISISFTTEQNMTVEDVRNKIKDLISEKKVVVESTVSNTETHTVIATNTNHVLHNQTVTVSTGTIQDYFDVEWSLNDIENGTTNDTFYIYPYISNVVHKPADQSFPLQRTLTKTSDSTEYTVTILGSSFFSDLRQSVSGVSYTFSNVGEIAYEDAFSCVGLTYTQSFKAGCTHEIGVVYYDKYNRSGNVNVIGSFYALPFGHSLRNGKNGPTSVNVDLSNVPVPSWASRFQLVYPGPSTYESFLTYTTGGGYVKRDSSNAVDTDHKFIYVSLKTLELYAKEKSSVRSYSFTPGDKLRVVSYGDTLTYADVQEYDGSSWVSTDATMDFNIVRVEVLSATDNPIIGNDTANADQYYGDFLVLEAPETTAATPTKKYLGFDWHVTSGQPYGNGDIASTDKWWGKNSLVEILTPKRQTSEKIYYEIGDSYEFTQKTANATVEHQLVITNQGSVHIRAVPCKTAILNQSSSTWNVGSPNGWEYISRPIESMSVSDIKTMNDWSMGRPQVRYEKAKTKSEFNGIVYSDAYEQDVLKNSLSSFNPSLANFHYVERAYGNLNYLYSLGDRVVSIQQHKVGLSGVNKGVINYADGSANVSMSTDVIGPTGYLSGDFGCGDMYKGIFGLNNTIFFFDPIRKKVIRFSTDQAYVISDSGMASYFDGQDIRDYVSGYDPLEDTYYMTVTLGNGVQDTVGYSLAESSWISRYTFYPHMYQNIGVKMLSFKPWSVYIAHIHNRENGRCIFHGGSSDDRDKMIGIKAVCNIAPSSVKVFNSMSVEGRNERRPFKNIGLQNPLELNLSTDTGNTSIINQSATYREGNWFYEIKPGRLSGNIDKESVYKVTNEFLTNADIKWLGKRVSSTFEIISGQYHTKVFFDNRVLDLQLVKGDILYSIGSVNNQIVSTTAFLYEINPDGSLVFVSTAELSLNNNSTYLLLNDVMNPFNGERPRGKYAIIDLYGIGPDEDEYQDLTDNLTRNVEIYCINVNVSDSKDHHDGGQNE